MTGGYTSHYTTTDLVGLAAGASFGASVHVCDMSMTHARSKAHASSSRVRPVGPMDKASASGAGDSRFESWAGQKTVAQRSDVCIAAFRSL